MTNRSSIMHWVLFLFDFVFQVFFVVTQIDIDRQKKAKYFNGKCSEKKNMARLGQKSLRNVFYVCDLLITFWARGIWDLVIAFEFWPMISSLQNGLDLLTGKICFQSFNSTFIYICVVFCYISYSENT